MNPFSRFLARSEPDREFRAFAAAWDEAEALIVATYRAGATDGGVERRWRRLRRRLSGAYPRWREQLAPFWREAQVAGEPAIDDPFLLILAPAEAATFVENWRLMQTLPAAREALNRLMWSHGQGRDRV